MKKISRILLVLLFLTFVLVFFSKVEAPRVKKNQNELKYTHYYVPVTNYWSQKENLTKEELKTLKKIIIEKGDLESFTPFLGEEKKNIFKREITEIQKGIPEDEIAIISYDKVTPNLKTLSFEGKYLWNKNDVKDYALKVEKKTFDKSHAENSFKSEKITKIVAGGDVMLSRHVATKIKTYGINAPWENIVSFLKNADITFVNLEVPISDLYPPPAEGMIFIAPLRYLEGLKKTSVDIVSVANNHSANFGRKVFEDNLKNLSGAKIEVCGGGENEKEARTPKIIEKNNIKFAFLCYNSITGGLSAQEKSSGTAFLEIEPWYRDNEENIKKLEADIKNAKFISDVVIVSPHWGVEYIAAPSESQRKVAKRAINAGAELILGTHPHVVQGSEYYQEKFISYSLGNLIFDQEWSKETKEGVILEVYFYGKKNVAAKKTPVLIEDYHRPKILNLAQGWETLSRIKNNSYGF